MGDMIRRADARMLHCTSFPNLLRNGNFAIAQRGSPAGRTLSAGQYGPDGFYGGPNGCTYTTAVSGIDKLVTISAGSLVQPVTGRVIEGGAYVLSWFGTSQARVFQQGQAAGSFAAMPAGGLLAENRLAGTRQNVEFGVGTVSLAQLQSGCLATAFERRDDELLRCQRFYCILGLSARFRTPAAAAIFGFPVSFPTTMESIPTATLVAAGERGNVGNAVMGYMTPNTATLQIVPTDVGDTYALSDTWGFSAELAP